MTTEEILIIIGAVSTLITAVIVPSVLLIIKAVKENTDEVKVGNEQAAVSDSKKIALSEAIAQPFTAPGAPGVATVAGSPLEERISRLEAALAERPR